MMDIGRKIDTCRATQCLPVRTQTPAHPVLTYFLFAAGFVTAATVAHVILHINARSKTRHKPVVTLDFLRRLDTCPVLTNQTGVTCGATCSAMNRVRLKIHALPKTRGQPFIFARHLDIDTRPRFAFLCIETPGLTIPAMQRITGDVQTRRPATRQRTAHLTTRKTSRFTCFGRGTGRGRGFTSIRRVAVAVAASGRTDANSRSTHHVPCTRRFTVATMFPVTTQIHTIAATSAVPRRTCAHAFSVHTGLASPTGIITRTAMTAVRRHIPAFATPFLTGTAKRRFGRT